MTAGIAENIHIPSTLADSDIRGIEWATENKTIRIYHKGHRYVYFTISELDILLADAKKVALKQLLLRGSV